MFFLHSLSHAKLIIENVVYSQKLNNRHSHMMSQSISILAWVRRVAITQNVALKETSATHVVACEISLEILQIVDLNVYRTRNARTIWLA